MKIALDATPLILSSGGLPRYVNELSSALAREFPEDTYLLLSDQPFALPTGAPENLIRGRGPHSGAHRRWWLWGIRNAIREAGAEIFHGTNFEVPYLGRTPAILTIHDLSPWRDPRWHDAAERVRQRTPWLVRFRRARMILTVSEAVRREVIGHFGVEPEQVRAVPLAASALFHPLPEAPPVGKPFFLFVGTLEPRKNVAALVEAWRETRGETGADLVIAGRNRPDFIPIAPCDGLNFLGEVPDAELPRLYSDALAFVYPTLYEGFGLPVLEAMQCGCPVITSRDPAVMEVAGGAAIHAGSVSEIAGAMRNMGANSVLRSDLRTAGLARAAAFSWRCTARRTHEIYEEIAAGGRP
ncbi:MAG: glycosyltransferase family 1 protein [Bryobacteraceae bacterium]|jgi:glycosyltransferase involved in cell wall biosynthesis